MIVSENKRKKMIKEGDVVKLKSGGPKMTAGKTSLLNGTNYVHCFWFVGSAEKEKSFPENALEKTLIHNKIWERTDSSMAKLSICKQRMIVPLKTINV